LTAYVIVSLRLRDRAWQRDYAANVPAIVRAYGGDYLAVGTKIVAIEGTTNPPDQIGILTFPTIAALNACLESPEYQPYKESRIGPADTEIIAFETK
jgi:uncharacterized protein (DUF1330 family)